MASDSFPVIVILHEAWHTPAHYGRLIDMLTAEGFATVCPQLLTAHTEENCTSSFNDDCSLVYQLVFDLASDGHDIVVLAHGYGSFVASECLAELSKQVRNNLDKQGGVTELISVAGLLPEHGQSLKDCYGGQWPDFNDDSLILYEPDSILYNDVGAMERDHWASHLVRFTARATDIVLTTGSPAWKLIHTTYAICEADLLYTEDLQREAVVSTAGIDSELLEDCGHCPMISGPERILAIVMAIAGEQGTYDGTKEHEHDVTCLCSNPPITFGESFGQTDPHPRCVCENRCVCHHKDDCPLKAHYTTMNPDCPCSYGEYYRRVSTADEYRRASAAEEIRRASAAGENHRVSAAGELVPVAEEYCRLSGTEGVVPVSNLPSNVISSADPLSSHYSGDFGRSAALDTGRSYLDDLADFEAKDPYASWDSGLATIGSIETTTQLDDRDIDDIMRDASNVRPSMRRSQSVTPESATSENSAQSAQESRAGKQVRDDTFVPKMMRKTTTLPI
ncbi:hypothetical protein BLS_000951 [Venturia inaequalis]|uniref:AB hydrolase-1 domain-containing protein n=1 Tax=Venturia inaequalis TaxID=5025 RepID=A0A8H3VBX6_VENIN|nr:hypothetical protein BLS_000951 [Venturia inaequalis]